MAAPNMTYSRALHTAFFAEEMAIEVKRLYLHLVDFLAFNQAADIPWSATTKSEFLWEDSVGNLVGAPFSRFQVSNAIGSLEAIRRLIEGNHLANLNQIAPPRPSPENYSSLTDPLLAPSHSPDPGAKP